MDLQKFIEATVKDIKAALESSLPTGGRVRVDFDLRVAPQAPRIVVVGDLLRPEEPPGLSRLQFSVDIDVIPPEG